MSRLSALAQLMVTLVCRDAIFVAAWCRFFTSRIVTCPLRANWTESEPFSTTAIESVPFIVFTLRRARQMEM